MSSFFNSASLLVHIAALFYVAGFLVRDQLILRFLVLVGTVCYLAYYYWALDTPLWDAIFWSLIMGAANLWVMVQLILERTTLNMSERDKKLYEVFNTMTPGEFRKLLKISSWEIGDSTTILTREDKGVDHLYYVIDGPISIEKQGQSFDLNHSAFIGEVAFFLGSNASATVRVAEGCEFVRWNKAQLQELQHKNAGIRAALHGLLNADMAGKVAKSMGSASIA